MQKSINITESSQVFSRLRREGRVRCISRHGFHHVAFREWGKTSATDNLLCVHGLTRNSRDFDMLAQSMSRSRRVVCADLVGRGKSDWLRDPSDYHLLQYNMDITVLAAHVGFESIDWIGTSLGGLMGISLAGIENAPIRRLIINDVGPEIPHAALRRITSYAGRKHRFGSIEEVELHLRTTLSPFAPMTDRNWATMARHSSVRDGGEYRMHHDPDIMQNFRRYFMFMNFNLWKYWNRIKCPILILRGRDSDFLTDRILRNMVAAQPNADVVEFDNVGHTPTLNAPGQIEPIIRWLDKTR